MPWARSHEVTVRRPRANNKPNSTTGKRHLVRLCNAGFSQATHSCQSSGADVSENRYSVAILGSPAHGQYANTHPLLESHFLLPTDSSPTPILLSFLLKCSLWERAGVRVCAARVRYACAIRSSTGVPNVSSNSAPVCFSARFSSDKSSTIGTEITSRSPSRVV